jgi:hypothetical protein
MDAIKVTNGQRTRIGQSRVIEAAKNSHARGSPWGQGEMYKNVIKTGYIVSD